MLPADMASTCAVLRDKPIPVESDPPQLPVALLRAHVAWHQGGETHQDRIIVARNRSNRTDLLIMVKRQNLVIGVAKLDSACDLHGGSDEAVVYWGREALT